MWTDLVMLTIILTAVFPVVNGINRHMVNQSLLYASSWDFSAFFLFLLECKYVTEDNSLNFKQLGFASPQVIGRIACKYLYEHDTTVILQHGLGCVTSVYLQSVYNLLQAGYSDRKVKTIFAAMQRHDRKTYLCFEKIYFLLLPTVPRRG